MFSICKRIVYKLVPVGWSIRRHCLLNLCLDVWPHAVVSDVRGYGDIPRLDGEPASKPGNDRTVTREFTAHVRGRNRNDSPRSGTYVLQTRGGTSVDEHTIHIRRGSP